MSSTPVTDLLRRWLEAPSDPSALALPEVACPDLGELEVVVPPPPTLDQATLLRAFDAHLRSVAPRRAREVGEFAEAGDDVRLVLGEFARGVAVPFTFREATVIAGRPDGVAPAGLANALVGVTPGEKLRLVDGDRELHTVVLGVTSLDLPSADDPDLLGKLGIEGTTDALMERLRTAWIDRSSDDLVAAAGVAVLDALRARAPVDVPPELISQEIRGRWAGSEGSAMLALGVGEADLAASLAHWTTSPTLVADAARRIHGDLLLGAIARRHALTVDPVDVEDHLRTTSEELGLDPAAVRDAFRNDRPRAEIVIDRIYRSRVLRWVLAHAEIEFQEP